MPSKQRKVKIWLTEDQILAAIQRAHDSIKRTEVLLVTLREQSMALAGELEQIRFKLMQPNLEQKEKHQLERDELSIERRLAYCKEDANKKSKAYNRLNDRVLPRLKDTLAAMRTQTMVEVMGEYRGVALK